MSTQAVPLDHRDLNRDLHVFATDALAGAGLPLWLPKGATIRRILEDYIVAKERAQGYEHVYSPDLAKVARRLRAATARQNAPGSLRHASSATRT